MKKRVPPSSLHHITPTAQSVVIETTVNTRKSHHVAQFLGGLIRGKEAYHLSCVCVWHWCNPKETVCGGWTHVCEVIISINTEETGCVEQLVGCSKGQALRECKRSTPLQTSGFTICTRFCFTFTLPRGSSGMCYYQITSDIKTAIMTFLPFYCHSKLISEICLCCNHVVLIWNIFIHWVFSVIKAVFL